MTDFIPAEKGVVIRMPSVANLMVDSADRVNQGNDGPWKFQITKSQALLNGYFTRVATTEVVLEWFDPNITSTNNTFTVVKTAGPTTYTVTVPVGTYTVEAVLDEIVILLNAAGTGLTWSITGIGASCALTATGAFTIPITVLASDLNLVSSVSAVNQYINGAPDIRPYTYIDFVSDQLTYNQNVKDATTNIFDKNVLCRWYFAWDNPPTYDAYGFPILMGYTGFVCRRLFNPPKQIKWEPNMPIGNLAFSVYGAVPLSVGTSSDLLSAYDTSTNWKMTLQLSEV